MHTFLMFMNLLALYKSSTVNVFKAHGLVQASIADCVTESFSAIRTVSSYLWLIQILTSTSVTLLSVRLSCDALKLLSGNEYD